MNAFLRIKPSAEKLSIWTSVNHGCGTISQQQIRLCRLEKETLTYDLFERLIIDRNADENKMLGLKTESTTTNCARLICCEGSQYGPSLPRIFGNLPILTAFYSVLCQSPGHDTCDDVCSDLCTGSPPSNFLLILPLGFCTESPIETAFFLWDKCHPGNQIFDVVSRAARILGEGS